MRQSGDAVANAPKRAVDSWVGHAADERSVQTIYYDRSDVDSQAFMLKVEIRDGAPAADAGKEKNK